MKNLSNIKISGKLYALILLAILVMVGTAGIGQYQMGRVFESANYATVNTVPSFNALNKAFVSFQKLRIALLDHVLENEDEKLVALDREIQEQRQTISKVLAYYQDKLISDPDDQRYLNEVSTAFNTYYGGMEVTLLLSRQHKDDEAKINFERNSVHASNVDAALQRHLDFNSDLAAKNSAHALGSLGVAFWTQIVVVALAIVVLVSFGWVIANRELAQPIGAVAENLKLLASGRLDVTITGVERRDEVGDIARAAQVFKEFVEKLDTQGWIKTHGAQFSAALQQADDFKALAQQAVSTIAAAIGAGHGALYVADSGNRFNLLGSYGYRERKQLNNSFNIGEGLVGQAAMEKKPITLSAPQNYIQISSGLGEGPPACISVLPIIHQDRVLAVLEVASFQQFSPREVALLDALVPALAVSMEIMNRNQRTKELLASTQQQAERMEKQAAQLEEQTVEMEAQQAELLKTENWFRSIIETAQDGMLVVDATGQVLLGNPMAAQLLGCQPAELLDMDFSIRFASLDLAKNPNFRLSTMSVPRNDGRSINLEVTGTPLPDRGGRGRCVSVALREHVAPAGAAA